MDGLGLTEKETLNMKTAITKATMNIQQLYPRLEKDKIETILLNFFNEHQEELEIQQLKIGGTD